MAREKPQPIDVYTLGMSGVVIDPQPLNPGTPGDALTQAQNVSHDPTLARGGALRKRPGFTKFNQINAAGPILGGCPMAVAGTGGAPTHGGGGDSGGSDGGGDGTGGGGGDGGNGGGGGTGGDGITGGGTGGGAFGAASDGLVVGMQTNNAADGHGWYVGLKKFSAAATVGTIPYAPGAPDNVGWSTGINGRIFCSSRDGWLYFMKAIASGDGAGTDTADLYRTNGTVTQFVTSFARYDSITNKYPVITAMTFANDTSKVYVAVRYTLYNAGTPSYRVYEIDHTTFVKKVVLGGIFGGLTVPAMWWDTTTQRLFMAFAYKLGQLYPTTNIISCWYPALGFGDETTNLGTSGQVVNCVSFQNTSPFPRAITVFNGCVYFSSLVDGTGASDYWVIGAQLSTTSGYGELASSVITFNDGLWTTIAGGAVAAAGGVYSLQGFKGKLYASWYNPGSSAQIIQCTQSSSGSPTCTYSAVYTNSGGTGRVPFELFVYRKAGVTTEDNDVMYAIGTTGLGGTHCALWTEDGVTWNDVTSNMLAANPASGYPLGILWGIDAA